MSKPDGGETLEVRFRQVEAELISKIPPNTVYGVESSEWLGGSFGLFINDRGKWSGKCDMMGYEIGMHPPLKELANELRDIIRDSLNMLKDPKHWKPTDREGKDEALREEAIAGRLLKAGDTQLVEHLISRMQEIISELSV